MFPLNQSQIKNQVYAFLPNYCDKCGHRHEREDMEIINSDGDKLMCKLECSSCKTIYMFHINSPMDGMFSTKKAQLKSSLTGDEVRKFSDLEPVTQDEVLDTFIKTKEMNNLKDFKELFKEEE